MRRWLHKLAHLFRLQGGEVVSEWRNGSLYVGFRCLTCGKTEDWAVGP